MRTTTLIVLLALAAPSAALAQARVPPPPAPASPSVSLRPFFLATIQSFSAGDTFSAVFGQRSQPLFGGGLDIAFRSGLFIDVTASRFSKTGQRVFRANDQNFPLGIPLTATEVPLEFTVGYRRRLPRSRVIPYVGGGFGSYDYQETSQNGSSAENVDIRHSGFLVAGGAEVRMSRWIGLSGDVQYTHVPGILGTGGISKAVNEDDLGGVAIRFRVIVGR